MNRRDFVTGLSGAGVSLALSRIAFASAGSEPLTVLVIGAGMSGMVAGYELKKAGYNVHLFEAQQRAGGRVHTIRDFADKQYAEAGAARIPADHDLTHRYIKEFNLSLVPFYPASDKFSIMDNGRRMAVDWSRFAKATVVMYLGSADRWSKINGGNDLLPKAFRDQLGARIHYNSPVRRVEHTSRGVTVTFSQNNALHKMNGDVLVCAVPLTMLRNIEISPALPDAKAKLISTASYDSASRVFLQTKTRFWRQQKLNGFGFGTNGDEIWDSSFGEDGEHGILQSYSRGFFSQALTQMAAPDRISATARSLDKLFGDVTSNLEKGYSKCWSEDPWVRGAWAHLDGNEMSLALRPEGRIHFAGEHVSLEPSWIQGALQSGLRVVNEINAAASSYKSASAIALKQHTA